MRGIKSSFPLLLIFRRTKPPKRSSASMISSSSKEREDPVELLPACCFTSCTVCHLLLFCKTVICLLMMSMTSAQPVINFCGELFNTWDPTHLIVLNNGTQLQLVLDQVSGSGLGSKDEYMYGHFEIQMKVAPGNTAGTVTSFYLSSAPTATSQEERDELDFEFLGNVSGQPYLLQTNIFTNGTGYKEQRIVPWFDPTASFHTYSITWTKQQVIFAVDGIAIRMVYNNEASGSLYVNRHPMGAFLSIWNGDDWATLGGLVKINWTAAPFVANYQNFKLNACHFEGNVSACTQSVYADNPFGNQLIDISSLSSVQVNFMVYTYCKDKSRFEVLPAECSLSS